MSLAHVPLVGNMRVQWEPLPHIEDVSDALQTFMPRSRRQVNGINLTGLPVRQCGNIVSISCHWCLLACDSCEPLFKQAWDIPPQLTRRILRKKRSNRKKMLLACEHTGVDDKHAGLTTPQRPHAGH